MASIMQAACSSYKHRVCVRGIVATSSMEKTAAATSEMRGVIAEVWSRQRVIKEGCDTGSRSERFLSSATTQVGRREDMACCIKDFTDRKIEKKCA